jgi:hypothetical protein
MPFGVRLLIIASDGRPQWGIDISGWWKTAPLFDAIRFNDVSTSAGYRDFEATLTVDEVMRWHERFRVDLADWQRPRASSFEQELARLDDSDRFILSLYEWESGLS